MILRERFQKSGDNPNMSAATIRGVTEKNEADYRKPQRAEAWSEAEKLASVPEARLVEDLLESSMGCKNGGTS